MTRINIIYLLDSNCFDFSLSRSLIMGPYFLIDISRIYDKAFFFLSILHYDLFFKKVKNKNKLENESRRIQMWNMLAILKKSS